MERRGATGMRGCRHGKAGDGREGVAAPDGRGRRAPGRASIRGRRGGLALGRRLRDESGSLVVFGLMMLVLMLATAGTAVDLMHHETRRTKVQNTLDAAVLAAANLDQARSPRDVVEDYFSKAGLAGSLGAITATKSEFSSRISARADVGTDTHFMKLAGVSRLQGAGASTAEESVGGVEIALVLDNSGSMGWNGRIENLKIAAGRFIDTMFGAVGADALSVSIVPYDSHVSLGPYLMSKLAVTDDQTKANCIDFLPLDYGTTAILPTALLTRSGHFDAQTYAHGRIRPECSTLAAREILPFSNDQIALKTKIESLVAGGYTSIESGVKWGAALLDPAARLLVDAMIGDGVTTPRLSRLPALFGDPQVMKVMVVMSDGQNTRRYQLDPAYKAGPALLMANSADGGYSLFDPLRGQYWISALGEWRALPWGAGTHLSCDEESRWWLRAASCTVVKDPGLPVPMTWPEVWDRMSVRWFTRNLIRPAYGWQAERSWYDRIVETVEAATMDGYLRQICGAARAKGITVYTIGFETSDHGAAMLRDCATAPGYHFAVEGAEIGDAFSAIAGNINLLRLTQ